MSKNKKIILFFPAIEFDKNLLCMPLSVFSLVPYIPIIWGGYLPTLEPDTVLKLPYVDAIVIGQGQLTLKKILKALNKGNSLKGIKGVYFKEKGTIIKNKKRPLTPLKFLSSVPYDEHAKKYLNLAVGSKTIIYSSSEGCNHRCTFCCVSKYFNQQWHAQEADRIIKDLITIKTKTKANGIHFCDPNFFVDLNRVKTICQEIIKKKLNLKWSAYGRLSQFVRFEQPFIELLKESGFSKIIVGAESGSQYILDNIKKGISTNEIFKLADLCSRNNIFVRFYFMVGFPDSPENVRKEIDSTLDIIIRLIKNYPNHDFHWNCYRPLSQKEISVVRKYGFKNPSKVEDWIELGDFCSANVPWIRKGIRKYLNMLLRYYIPVLNYHKINGVYHCKGSTKIIVKAAQHLAKWRLKNKFFFVPFEYWIFQISKKLKSYKEKVQNI